MNKNFPKTFKQRSLVSLLLYFNSDDYWIQISFSVILEESEILVSLIKFKVQHVCDCWDEALKKHNKANEKDLK